VYVVDDDASVRRSLARLVLAAGYSVTTFASGREFLDIDPQSGSGCVVLDIQMEGMSGLEVQERLVDRGVRMPIIFITAHDNVATRRHAERFGAVAYLQKPFEYHVMLDAIHRALDSEY
jgi:FixJ family two-component response regulator